MFIDAHSHIYVKNFDADREQVIARLKAADVSKIIEVGFDSEGIFKALALAKKHSEIYAAVGIHPHLASEWSSDLASKILKMAKSEEKIVALGEMGLDYYLPAGRQGKNFQPKDVQEFAFRGQLKIAQKTGLPIIIHCRDAYKDLFRILDEEKFGGKVLLHCFTGTLKEAREGIARGYFIAFTGVITYPGAKLLREIAGQIPLDRILIETDCPFLAPQSHRGQRNEPAFVVEIYKEIARIKSLQLEKLVEQINKNANAFFGIF